MLSSLLAEQQHTSDQKLRATEANDVSLRKTAQRRCYWGVDADSFDEECVDEASPAGVVDLSSSACPPAEPNRACVSTSSLTSRNPFLNSTMLLPTDRATSGKRRPKINKAITPITIHSAPPGSPNIANSESFIESIPSAHSSAEPPRHISIIDAIHPVCHERQNTSILSASVPDQPSAFLVRRPGSHTIARPGRREMVFKDGRWYYKRRNPT